MKGKYVKCSHCGNPVAEDMIGIHDCHEKQKGIIHHVDEHTLATPQRLGDYFVHQDSGEEWNAERVNELNHSFFDEKRKLLKKIDDVGAELVASVNETAEVKEYLKAAQTQIGEEYAKYSKAYDEIQATREAWKEQKKLADKLTGAVSELKSILFNKELTIAQNSGYIQRVKELDPKLPENMVTVPESKLYVHGRENQAMDGFSPWNKNWWDIGKENE